jgi:transposase
MNTKPGKPGLLFDREVVLRRRLRRSQIASFFAALPRCIVGIEACGTAHFWAREIARCGA